MMHVRFWGVRGSIPSPGPTTNVVGGNTSCVEVLCDHQRIVFDAGTGLRGLGEEICRAPHPCELDLFLSHVHWDHIQGLPFFAPLYMPSTQLRIHADRSHHLQDALSQQMRAPMFPVDLHDVPAQVACHDVRDRQTYSFGNVNILARRLHHPGGVMGYRLEYGGGSIAYATDTEHNAHVDRILVELASGVDILIYDAQFTPEEYAGTSGPSRTGWGHSTFEAAARLADQAGVAQLVLFHHDPSRSDDAVADIERRAQALRPATTAARESTVIPIARRANSA